ncbi:ABC transporter substrate-binding protein [Pararhodospirillum oryzae]|uniref:Toluene tolerance protein n=1 Tax=Pararhodospirillum oryzae TaxID=478448 RepID=A0A512H5L7_9PROT|nr:ABC transporter substrate-binding protein [Pararhodospirillum oryzae]GEO80737.1 toluene tolerance protein [Pararhodospirillum oryzae]
MNRRLACPFWTGVLLAVVLAALAVSSPARAQNAPAEVVGHFHDALLSVMRDAQALGPEGRRARLDGPVRATFDFARMARVVAGRAAREASPEQQARYIEAFARFSVATYAARFTGWSGQRFETLGTDPGPQGTTLVRTRLVQPSGEPIALTYVTETAPDQPARVIDVLMQGSISELAVRRSEYAATLTQGGLDALSAALETQATTLLAPAR